MNTNKQPYQSWKASGLFGNFIGKTPANIRPFTNKDYTNTATSGFGLPRPLKHYRLGRSDRIVNSPRGQTIRQTIDTPGGYISQAEPTCIGATIELNLAPNPSLTETPQDFSQTETFCCNAQKKAYKRVLPTSSKLNDSSINSDIQSTYYSTLTQYRDNRCQTYHQRAFNFFPHNAALPPPSFTEYYAKCTPSNKNCSVVVYNPNNPQFAIQGSAKSSARTFKIKNTTIETSGALHNNYNNYNAFI